METRAVKNNSGFTSFDENYNYEADDAEAVVYLISKSAQLRNTALYVMKRYEAVEFCSRIETANNLIGPRCWAYCFTTHRLDWRNELDTFRKDDGRFDKLLDELKIKPIYKGGDNLSVPVIEIKKKNQIIDKQIQLFDELKEAS